VLAALGWWLMQPVGGVPRYRVLWDRYAAPHFGGAAPEAESSDRNDAAADERATLESPERENLRTRFMPNTAVDPDAEPIDARTGPPRTMRESAAGTAAFSTACRTCQGFGTVPCTNCGGRGSVLVQVFDPCKQCNGTGAYRSRMGSKSAPCPFCNKTGKISREESRHCPACAGSGRTPCATCQGTKQPAAGNAPAK